MKRTVELSPLSRDHHVALEHALRLRRASAGNLTQVVAAFLAFLSGPGRAHFAQEEQVLAPELPADGAALGRRMAGEHERILSEAAALGITPDVRRAHALGELLNRHVRFEERELFPVLEASLSPARLRDVARRLER